MEMGFDLRKLAVTFTIIAIILSFTPSNMKVTFSTGAGGKIDLFTQKEPYSGKGPRISSDAFSFGEEVQIHALATYNDCPVSNVFVGFQILGPKNPTENITSYRVASTDENGIATISFRIPNSNVTAYGEWTVIGNARIVDSTFQDSINFKVGWIVEIVSIKTVNKNGVDQEKFMTGTDIGIELVLRNIAMTVKKATITVAIYDHLNMPLNSTILNNFELTPNGTLVPVHFSLYIPINANLGQSIAYVCAYTTSVGIIGVPYCHEASKYFSIINRDVAVLDVKASPAVVYKGEIVSINVTVRNKGSEIESVTISIYGNETLIDNGLVNLQPFSNKTLSFTWNTSHSEGSYLISAFAAPVPDEIYVSDNKLDDGTVKVKAPITQPKGWFVPDWFYWFILPLLILIIIFIILLYRRNRKKKAEEAFHSGWTAWYYCYDLKDKIHKV